MYGTRSFSQPLIVDNARSVTGAGWRRATFIVTKRVGDVLISLALLPLIVVAALALLIINPWLNRGPLLFVQKRMGRGCRPFTAIKFRTMTESSGATRSAECPLEVDRITPLGHFLRQTRIDELPQAINVLRGEMSLIGPRPDCYEHAEHYLNTVPGYRKRHLVRPGISGLAQTEVGYVAGSDGTFRKVQADLYYVSNAGLRMDLWILWRTLSVVFKREGS